jgi:hypothetical protein
VSSGNFGKLPKQATPDCTIFRNNHFQSKSMQGCDNEPSDWINSDSNQREKTP